MLKISVDKLAQAILIVARVEEELENSEDGYVGFHAEFESDGLWLHDDGESIDVEHAAALAQALLDGLKIDEPFVFSWAYTCSKPRLDEFGGGACAVRRGKAPIWCDARQMVETQLEQEKEPGPIEEAPVADDAMAHTVSIQTFERRLGDVAAEADRHQAINVKVAGYCGWINFEPGWWRHPEKKIACEDWDLPDYMNDLNACREMEQTLRPNGTYACEKWWRYRSNLIDICSAERNEAFVDHLDATASQRVRAFLRTMEEPNIDRS